MRAAAGSLALALTLVACGGGTEQSAWEPLQTTTHWWMSATVDAESGWIVGGTTTDGAILRLSGDTTTEVDHGTDVGLLNWVHRFDDGELVVVGNDGAVLRSPDGESWSREQAPTDQDLWGVWGSSPSDIWAVGGSTDDGVPTILRDSGSGFEAVEVPDLQRPGVGVFFKVWGSGPGDVYIVGQHGAVLHWDGSHLEELLVGVGQDLIGVWGTGPDQVAVVGGRGNAQAALWNGAEWTTVDLARHSGLNGVWFDDSTVHVVGNDGVVGTIDFETGEATIQVVDTPVALHAVNGSSDRLVAVGGDFTTGPDGPFLGQVWKADR